MDQSLEDWKHELIKTHQWISQSFFRIECGCVYIFNFNILSPLEAEDRKIMSSRIAWVAWTLSQTTKINNQQSVLVDFCCCLFVINLARVRIIWEEEPPLRKCLHQISCRQVCGKHFLDEWLMLEGPDYWERCQTWASHRGGWYKKASHSLTAAGCLLMFMPMLPLKAIGWPWSVLWPEAVLMFMGHAASGGHTDVDGLLPGAIVMSRPMMLPRTMSDSVILLWPGLCICPWAVLAPKSGQISLVYSMAWIHVDVRDPRCITGPFLGL